MSSIRCDRHAAIPARWRCAACHLNLCTSCAPKAPRADKCFCPVCRERLQSLGMGNVIKPFWERIPRFFLYPAKSESLVVILGLSALSILGVLPIIGLAAMLVVVIVSLRFCYRVLYHTALGNLEPPGMGRETEFRSIVLQQLGVFFVLFSIPGVVAGLTQNGTMFILSMGGVFLLLPAAVMTLAIEESFLSAINPLVLLQVAGRIGPPYLLLWFMLTLLLGGGWTVAALLPPLPNWLELFASNFFSIYFFVAMFHMMGYVVYQYHEQLGFVVDKDFAESNETSSDFRRYAATPAPDRVSLLITEGKYEEAADELKSQLRENLDDLRLHERYHRLLLTQGKLKDRGMAHADLYIGRLLEHGQQQRALEVYRRSASHWGPIEIKDANDAVALARHTHERGDPRLALPMLGRFTQRFPDHVRIPEAQLLAAQLLADELGRVQMARQMVVQLQQRYPEHPLRPQMDTLLVSLDRMAERAARRQDSPGEMPGG